MKSQRRLASFRFIATFNVIPPPPPPPFEEKLHLDLGQVLNL